ncbi:MAG TPA: TnpV protein [Bacilli bacterium]|nr:TnpV protein [Bacilli bacterium]
MTGDYELPNLALEEKTQTQLGKYAMMRLKYLKEYKKALYQTFLMKDKLMEHLAEIELSAEMRVNYLVEEMSQKENVTEEMKVKDQMKWVGLMNNFKISAEEIVARELIYA